MNEYEAAVIEAAQDWAGALEGGHYGPMQPQIEQAKKRLLYVIADLQAAYDSRRIPSREEDKAYAAKLAGIRMWAARQRCSHRPEDFGEKAAFVCRDLTCGSCSARALGSNKETPHG